MQRSPPLRRTSHFSQRGRCFFENPRARGKLCTRCAAAAVVAFKVHGRGDAVRDLGRDRGQARRRTERRPGPGRELGPRGLCRQCQLVVNGEVAFLTVRWQARAPEITTFPRPPRVCAGQRHERTFRRGGEATGDRHCRHRVLVPTVAAASGRRTSDGCLAADSGGSARSGRTMRSNERRERTLQARPQLVGHGADCLREGDRAEEAFSSWP